METYKQLHLAIGKPEDKKVPSETFFTDFAKKSDEYLIKLWREDGFSSYGNGLFWTVDPQEYAEIVKDWKIVKPKSIVFGRNAFGELFLLHKNEVYILRIQENDLGNLGPSVYIFLNSTLKEPSLKESYLQKKLFSKVKKKNGELKADECYGLFPALPLGGDDEDENAYKCVKIKEYLASLAQMNQ
ncbi:MAG TPA: GAD-like domain-containing protein [Pyrinomonadaceae bacterium]|nr:GAD-like domain-containing protein [Pyrinomonadaceae bacterium]